ncbi:MAG: TIGR01777 family protein [Xanthomonadales bacterium]|nr:TIGR01777 family protein [Xanthomonadales bacterium]|tara:strand:+ start:1703 stop:2602 length:900 start_codon:yes stop_codon:yes gene_type:complete
MRVLITGATGFIGQPLCRRLADKGHELLVVSRSPEKARAKLPDGTEIRAEVSDFVDTAPEAVINLAGEPIAEGRWTDEKKRRIVESRVETTRAIVELCAGAESAPKVLVSASAMGYYGDQGDREVTEDTAPNHEFVHEICDRWETEARKAESHDVRVAIARIGLVLDTGGGMLAKTLTPFKMGVGGRLGDGKQYMPWIHREDMVRILVFLLERDDLSGPFNASAPNPVTNAEFTQALANQLNRPAVLPAPAIALKIAFGEMSRLLLTGAKMLPERLEDAGFEFRYCRLEDALSEILAAG